MRCFGLLIDCVWTGGVPGIGKTQLGYFNFFPLSTEPLCWSDFHQIGDALILRGLIALSILQDTACHQRPDSSSVWWRWWSCRLHWWVLRSSHLPCLVFWPKMVLFLFFIFNLKNKNNENLSLFSNFEKQQEREEWNLEADPFQSWNHYLCIWISMMCFFWSWIPYYYRNPRYKC